ncbi:hypothetical protein CIK64_05035 [Brevibacterium aurantiacum]|uniref:Uncharacterized protein n=1 Tax=Brevibacterium aurantiacum TaxID=273384 RepID=A0A2A3Z7L7_BREAU|nr:hypothetical protein CIK64_05035 [Brevibacterium aurantiacum]
MVSTSCPFSEDLHIVSRSSVRDSFRVFSSASGRNGDRSGLLLVTSVLTRPRLQASPPTEWPVTVTSL